MFVDVIFVFVNQLRVFFFMDVFFWWILAFCSTFAERVFFIYISRTIRFVIFGLSFVILLLEESFCIIISLLITILLSIFSFSNNSILAINLLVWKLMFASAKTWSIYYLFDITSLRRTQTSFMKKSFNAKYSAWKSEFLGVPR